MLKKRLLLYRWHIAALFLFLIPTAIGISQGCFTNKENLENRELSSFPKITCSADLTKFPAKFETYYVDHLPMKDTLVASLSKLHYTVYRESFTEQVIIGDDGWLFYNKAEDGDPIADYKGTNLYTEEEMAYLAGCLEDARIFLEEQGTQFLFVLAPGKEKIYGQEHLPSYYKEGEVTRSAQFLAYLNEHYPQIQCLDLQPTLSECAQSGSYDLYYKTDTHWNQLGAYIGSQEVLKKTGRLPAEEKTQPEESTLLFHSENLGDLAGLLGLKKDTFFSETDVTISTDSYASYVTEFQDYNLVSHYYGEATDDVKLILNGDSFSTYMIPYLAGYYSEMYRFKRDQYKKPVGMWEAVENMHPDWFVYETTDRYLSQISTLELTR